MSTLLILFGIAAAIGASCFLVQRQDKSERQRALRHMQDRQPLSPDEFGQRYFPPDQSDIAAQVATIFGKHISVEVSQAHPDDKLVEDLRMDSLDSMSTVEFVIELEEHFKITIPDSAAEQMRTLRDITHFISRELQSNQCA